MNGYRCIACDTRQADDFSGFVCPSCGGNLDITYDYDARAADIAQGFVAGNDVFRYAPLLPVKEPAGGFPLKVGGTPLVDARRPGAQLGLPNLWLKDDTGNPSASFKDRASVIALCRAVETGARTVAVASTGNAGSSTACIAAALGLRAVVFVPASAPPAKLTQALAYGATLLAVRGDYDDAYELCLDASREYGWYNRSTGYNPFTREGKKTCAFEIWEQLGGVPDRVVVPTGDGNILSGIWKGWRDLAAVGLIDRLPKIDCVQSDQSAAIAKAARRVIAAETAPDWSTLTIEPVSAATVADSISVNQPRDALAAVRAIVESGGAVVTLSDDDILAAIPEIASATGLFVEPAAAAPWAAVKHMLGNGTIDSGERVVCLATGNGLKDAGAVATTTGKPLVIDASIDAVRAVLRSD